MRTIRFIVSIITIVVVTVFMVLTMGSLSSAQQAAEGDELKAVYPNYLLPHVNDPCPRGSQKMFIVNFKVPRQERIRQFREFMLVTKAGNVLSDEGYRVNRRRVEYYLFPRKRTAQINLYDMTRNLAYAKYTSHEYTMLLASDCIEQLPPGME